MEYNFNIDTRYLNGKIYRIYSKTVPNLQYIGSTIRSLDVRFKIHKAKPTNELMAKLFLTYNDVVIELIELFPCLNLEQLLFKEQCYITSCIQENKITLNKATASITHPISYPKSIVEWYLYKHPEHCVLIYYIILRDYPTAINP